MGTKTIVLLALALGTGIQLLLQLIHYRSADNPIPENISNVYDPETYLKWQHYHSEQSRLGVLETLVSGICVALLLLFDVHVVFASLFGSGLWAGIFSLLLCQSVVDLLCRIPFSYVNTFVIEEKYGFNRSTMKTYIRDQILGFCMGYLLNFVIVFAITISHMLLGDSMVWLLSVAMCLFALAVNLLFPLISRLQNKFTSLEDGELRIKLTDLLIRHGYTVKSIEVMDASRRTTKSNAFFSGIGKQKRIVLDDNLVNSMTEDEICAVFSHELGHGLHKDIPKLLVMNCVRMVIIAILSWLVVRTQGLHTTFGFDSVNYGFAYHLLGVVVLPLVMYIPNIIINAYSRKAEYAADAQAVTEGYGPALVSALEKLSRENFSHLSPNKLIVVLEYSHPPLSQRIHAIDALQNQAHPQ